MSESSAEKERLFDAAVEIGDAGQRSAFLASECPDATLRSEVEELLRHHFAAGDFLSRAVSRGDEGTSPTLSLGVVGGSRHAPTQVGPYKLLEVIGEGGMGAVYMAEQTAPVKRLVALKLIKPGMDTRQVLSRFNAERQALALMDHPHIAKVLDAGTTEEGRPYFVMELVKGVPITQFCDERRLSPRERLELFIPVCQAVQHAHQKGIIHRDIKPSNVMVALYDGKPVPKVIDFGVAKAMGPKLTEATLYTGYGTIVGTPEYMSPEQAELNQLDIDTRSDIYSLGVLLYELLTGTTPIDRKQLKQAAILEVLRVIREEDPQRPSTRLSTTEELPSIAANRNLEPRKLTGLVRGELDWIVMKALEKDRARRYETANGLAADVQRYLNDESVEACPPSAWYRVMKGLRRHRVFMTTGAVVALALILGSVISVWQAKRAFDAEKQMRTERDHALRAEEQARIDGNRATAMAAFLVKDLLSEAEPAQNAVEDKVTLLEVLDCAAAKVGERFAKDPEVEEPIREALARTYHSLAAWEKSEQQWRRLVELAGRPGAKPGRRSEAEGELAHILSHRGRVDDEVLELARSALAGLTRELGPDHPDTLIGRDQVSRILKARGRYEEAIQLDEESLRLYEARLGPDHFDTQTQRHNLAVSYNAAGRYQEAAALLERLLQSREATLGVDHPETLATRHNLATAYGGLRRWEEALKQFERNLEACEKRLGPEHDNTWNCRESLAEAYFRVGRAEEAIRLLEPTLGARTAKLGVDHPATLGCRNILAEAYFAGGRQEDGIRLHEENLKLRAVKLGEAHPDTVITRSNLAKSYQRVGRNAEAIRLHEENLQREKDQESVSALMERESLAQAYFRMGRQEEAVGILEDVLRGYEGRHGAEHPEALVTRNNLATIYLELGRKAEAIRLFEENLKRREAGTGWDKRQTVRSRKNLEMAYLRAGRGEEAIRLAEGYRERCELEHGRGHPLTMDAWSDLATVYEEQNRMGVAEPLVRAVLDAHRASEKPGSLTLAMDLSRLGWNLLRQGKWAEAEPLLRESLTIRTTQRRADDGPRFHMMSQLGEALLNQGKYAEAEALIVEAFEGLNAQAATLPAKARPRLAEAGQRVVVLYDAWGKYEKAAEWRKRLGLTLPELPSDVFACDGPR